MLLAYADETDLAGKLRVDSVDPGATRTRMRARAYPGEDPDRQAARGGGRFIVERLASDAPTGERVRVEA